VLTGIQKNDFFYIRQNITSIRQPESGIQSGFSHPLAGSHLFIPKLLDFQLARSAWKA